MIGRRGFIGAAAGVAAGVFAAARGAFGAAREVEQQRAAFNSFAWPVLGDQVIITQWFPTKGPVDWTMMITGISYQASNEPGDNAADWRMLLAGYQDPNDGLGRRTFRLDIRMDQARFRREPPFDRLRIDWWPWGRP